MEPHANDRKPVDTHQTLSDVDQSNSDTDQTSADSDQTNSDTDQTSADSDQIASNRDQAASDRDLTAGVDPHEHRITSDMRRRSTEERALTARARLEAASGRDEIARARDLLAIARDQAADARDLAMAQNDAANSPPGSRADFGADIILRAADQRRRAAEYRVLAAEHRAAAAEDRRAAAEDRLAAARDRELAAEERIRSLAEREKLAAELALAETDALTGARTRAAGLRDLDRELDRCRRTGRPLVVVYVDVVGLKQLNDTLGHAAGDELLREVATLFRQHLRSYDLIVRVGGDEFLCAIPNMSETEVRERFGEIGRALAGKPGARGIRTGFATLRDQDGAGELIARADSEMIQQRATSHPSRRGAT